ncbi:MAG: hypothetical protein A3F63_08265 [Pseudomonadales bacterium RIFCSPHIGHO2_12_FULL_40_16]|jgi:hypothetical protein|uniref:hypothetical protein n=1 Tax=Acinetobacter johnsonii TaxID=40214 RepID=UPI0008CFE9D2|nr:hypothetical protein [Acinetobacter johnsonii]MCF7641609.1 hypothetical protein [Acinetobacter johnsonii]OFW84448.1 MAG: hypothetical protein A2W44_10420 [Acinetobacter sp. RIFCSPHIGHO2_12_41_5]OHC23483.1 MAG: hypothetical protein A3F63_08265 [Pseudomonadales bacterium RIFCSPHIGHO2_12_FULL_40_16]
MTDLNGVLKFSFGLDQLAFEMDGQHIQLDQGLSFIQSNSMRHGLLDELAIESMIYVIEELLESAQMKYAQPKTAVTSDGLFQRVLVLFFPDQQKIDRVQLESAFNTFVERREYYVSQVADDSLSSLIYFIVLREMMHHWNVVEIQFEQLNFE